MSSPAQTIGGHTDETAIDQLAALLKSSGDRLRLEILRVLDKKSFGVQELCSIFSVRQPTMSHHLKVLAKAQLVTTRREGNSIFYHRHHRSPAPQWQSLWHELLAVVDALPLDPDLQRRIAAVHSDRAESSRQFFQQNAGRFRAQQELIAEYRQYAQALRKILQGAELPQCRLALEIGPGEGAFLADLSTLFEHVVALDISMPLLTLAREFARQHQLDNIEFLHGDSGAALELGLQADCVVANMVLHHTASPAELFQDIFKLLKHGGSVFLSELCLHDQTWTRDACGDIWLGFDPEDISHWAAAAGLREGQHLYYAQRNGFSVQVRQFVKTTPSEAANQ